MTTSANDIRRSFLKYFEDHGHRNVPSSPLVPHDPTLLFINAGMNQFKEVFLGEEKRDYTRATSSQKCMRVSGKHNDLDNVGPSLRHHTFFEMLGNFSFGDYFKKEAIEFAWTLLTEVWKMPPDRLIVSIFKGEAGIPRDDEAYDIWRRFVPADKIVELGADDNFWQMGDTGPCGRCTEIYYGRGTSSDHGIEIWNNVFMEFDRHPSGVLKPLPAPSIDTGMGLERITAVLQGKESNYDTDLFRPIIERIEHLVGIPYGTTTNLSAPLPDIPAASEGPGAIDVSMRVIADHIRAMTFLITDGVMPSNELRGYVLRKIMRRAMRHGKKLGLERPLLHTLVDTVIREFGEAYPELRANRDTVVDTVRAEEQRFESVLGAGLPKLEALLAVARTNGTHLSGEDAFKLSDSLGVPIDFIEDIASSQHIPVDRNGFDALMKEQRKRAQERSAFRVAGSELEWHVNSELNEQLHQTGDQFVGYDSTTVETEVAAIFDSDGKELLLLDTNEEGFVALNKSPFYLEKGGQVSDAGRIFTQSDEAVVLEVMRVPRVNWPRLHRVRVERGQFRYDAKVTAEVTSDVRDATRRHHTATHLLHSALRRVLGNHVRQAGSLVNANRLRFDFVHPSPISIADQITIEQLVNEQILKNIPVRTVEQSMQEALATGAIALFGEKYGDRVRVVSIPDFSVELCGGTHVRSTGDIGLFKIVSESGIAAGVRRIDALTGMRSVEWVESQQLVLAEILAGLVSNEQQRANLAALRNRLAHAQIDDMALRGLQASMRLPEENKRLARELQQVKMKAVLSTTVDLKEPTYQLRDIKVWTMNLPGLGKEGLREVMDKWKDVHSKSSILLLASEKDGKVALTANVTPDLVKTAPAGEIVKGLAPKVGGRGGGRADFAEAGGKDPSKITEMLDASRGVIEKLLPPEA